MQQTSNFYPSNDDLLTILAHNKNLLFVVKKNQDQFHCTFLSGKLQDKLQLPQNIGADFIVSNESQLREAFTGKEVGFEHHYKKYDLCTTLLPVVKENEVVEVIGTTTDITSFKQTENEMNYMATHDMLTNLPNRQKFFDDLTEILEGNSEKALPRAIVIFGLDRLKNVNDTLGQFSGDRVIAIIAERLQANVPNGCPVYRLGGDEFVMLMNHEPVDVNNFARKMLQLIRQPMKIVGKDFYMTGTIGINYFSEKAKNVEEYVNRASVAIHYGKTQGGNCIIEYTRQMSEQYNELILLESDIRKAFKLKEFTLSYQPKVDVNTDEIIGVEALIRWEHGKKGKISPSIFIPIAEQIGMIAQIGEWVLKEACMQFVKWQKSGASPVIVAVNISAVELQQPNFLIRVKQIIQETGMDPNYLEIEITENSVMQNTEECIERMNELRRMGISLSIDDFGTGYSSMGYLQKFPINYLKIDQSFLRELRDQSGSAEIIKAMIQLGHTFGLKVVAEGVEEEDILSFIRNEQCDYYQGYFYSKPLTPDLIEEKLLM
ncbi:bifunctional diguanylate cyclase/phosphodiesterase [Gracilibacillus sp. S3-1-1]|uniref:Bifunctional diguanylate cyclase/phosphodiesterase n=1 Tax=Gracilibacillus pellucidus TaxID=3095368 RepID=A0ACC6M7P9_9BACI|nr:bifunctional diguanylate cyclase/phosphodiesterase [Gracilibacillus sp. S3-1-1]MDX8046893.1 bifunctional diguanylate cyclase/phosphodiesterase [Gracilibacillus sp. S3-1-1]